MHAPRCRVARSGKGHNADARKRHSGDKSRSRRHGLRVYGSRVFPRPRAATQPHPLILMQKTPNTIPVDIKPIIIVQSSTKIVRGPSKRPPHHPARNSRRLPHCDSGEPRPTCGKHSPPAVHPCMMGHLSTDIIFLALSWVRLSTEDCFVRHEAILGSAPLWAQCWY